MPDEHDPADGLRAELHAAGVRIPASQLGSTRASRRRFDELRRRRRTRQAAGGALAAAVAAAAVGLGAVTLSEHGPTPVPVVLPTPTRPASGHPVTDPKAATKSPHPATAPTSPGRR